MRKPSHFVLVTLTTKHGQSWNCTYCGSEVQCCCDRCIPVRAEQKKAWRDVTHVATIDHVIAQRNGGTWAYANLVIACSRCNHLKADLHINGRITLASIERARKRAKLKRQEHKSLILSTA